MRVHLAHGIEQVSNPGVGPDKWTLYLRQAKDTETDIAEQYAKRAINFSKQSFHFNKIPPVFLFSRSV